MSHDVYRKRNISAIKIAECQGSFPIETTPVSHIDIVHAFQVDRLLVVSVEIMRCLLNTR